MSPNVPDLKNLDLAFSHRLESSYQWATLAPFFDIKVTRYRTCISDRLQSKFDVIGPVITT